MNGDTCCLLSVVFCLLSFVIVLVLVVLLVMLVLVVFVLVEDSSLSLVENRACRMDSSLLISLLPS